MHYLLSVSLIQSCIDYCKKNPVLAGIAIGLAAALIALLIVIPCVASARKKKRLALEAEKAEKAKQTTDETVETVTTEIETVEAAESIPVQAVDTPEPQAERIAQTETIAQATEQSFATETVEVVEAAETAEAQAAPVQSVTEEKEERTARQTRYTGKWVIYRVVTEKSDDEKNEELYFFELRASNGEKLLSSEEYTSYSGAVRGIETHKKNILAGNFRVTLSKKGHYIFKLLNGKSTLLCTGENYPSRARCEKAIVSTKRFAETAVLDENTQELLIKLPPEDDAPITALPEGCAGKWIISSNASPDGETVYYFELFANNGEKLLSSEEYSSYAGAMNGLETHKKNIANGNFRITLTKRGDYIYKLLNGNGQLLCLGEHYRTRKLCQNAVESVKRFALSSPALTSNGVQKNP